MKWQVHDENITILGMQSSGKTTLARAFLAGIPAVARLIVSPQNPQMHYGQYGEPITSPDQIADGRAMLWAGPTDMATFAKICDAVMRCNNMVMIVDDAHEFATKQKIPPEWSTLINSGRNRGITSIFVSPAPNLLHNVLLQSSAILCSYRFLLESQIEYAKKNFFGDLAYLLMPVASRPRQFQDLIQIGKHDFLSRHVADSNLELHRQDGSIIPLSSTGDAQDGRE